MTICIQFFFRLSLTPCDYEICSHPKVNFLFDSKIKCRIESLECVKKFWGKTDGWVVRMWQGKSLKLESLWNLYAWKQLKPMATLPQAIGMGQYYPLALAQGESHMMSR